MIAKQNSEFVIARIAAAIGEPARVRILYSLLDNRARTATELASIADVSASTASAHLGRLAEDGLLKLHLQGKHRYYSLAESNVASALEVLSVVAGVSNIQFIPNTPDELKEARTCYDHIAGKVGVLLHNSIQKMGWISESTRGNGYDLTTKGMKAMESLGIDVDSMQAQRRRFAYACLDWSERQPHIGGALGAAILKIALKRKWVSQEFDSRVLTITRRGKEEMHSRFGVQL